MLASNQQHFRRSAPERAIFEAVKCLLHNEARVRKELRETGCGIQADAMAPLAFPVCATPSSVNLEQPGKWIERSLVRDERAVRSRPPILAEKARHYSVPASAVPDENAPGLEDASELPDHKSVFSGMREEAKGREEIHYRVEPSAPARRHFPHVADGVAKCRSGAAPLRYRNQMLRVVEAIYVIAVLSQQMRVASLPARHVENSGADRQAENFDQARDFRPVALGREDRLVLPQIMGVEMRLPPLRGLFQKKTGSL